MQELVRSTGDTIISSLKTLRICCGPANRGASIHGDKIFMATLDAKLLAFDRMSGEILWESEIIDYSRGFSATSAPLIVKNLQ